MILKLRPRSDYFFTVTGWELTTLRHLHRVVEDNIDELLHRYDVPEGAGHVKARFDLELVEARVPQLFRVPLISMAWSLYEACLIETSRFFAAKLRIPYEVGTHYKQVPLALQSRWGRWNPLSQARHFFATEISISMVDSRADEVELDRLRELRNVLVHTGGRSSPTRDREWQTLSRIAAGSDGIDIGTGYVVMSRDFVSGQIDLVDRCATHLVNAARAVVTQKRLYD